jgi:hypothetical protein
MKLTPLKKHEQVDDPVKQVAPEDRKQQRHSPCPATGSSYGRGSVTGHVPVAIGDIGLARRPRWDTGLVRPGALSEIIRALLSTAR